MAARKTKPVPKRKPKTKPQVIEVIDNEFLDVQMLSFVNHYITCMNGTEAARLAEYAGDDATLAVQANRLLRNAKVLREIDNRLKSFTMSANEVLIHLTDIARGDIADALNSVGGIDQMEAKRRGKSHIIKRFKDKVTTITEKDGSEREIVETEIEMYDRLDALKTLAKFHSLLIDRVRQEDWRTDIIKLLQEGKITPAEIEAELGYEIAQELTSGIIVSSVNAGESG